MAAEDEVAEELYGLLPGEFVAARDAAAKAARADGDRDAAEAIKALRKPTTTAWLVNLLMRDDPDLPDRLRALGEGLRDAESSLAGEELTALDKQRRQLVAGLVRTVRALARDVGQRVTQDSADEVSQTLLAALADPDVADDVLSGQLTQARTHVGFGAGRARSHLGLVPPLDEDRGGKARSGARNAAKGPSAPDRQQKAQEAQEARDAERERRARERREAAAAALEQAEADHTTAAKEAREAERVLSRSRATLGERTATTERLADELEQLTRRLDEARAAEKTAKAEVAEHEDRHARAAKALKWAVRDRDQAKAEVERLT